MTLSAPRIAPSIPRNDRFIARSLMVAVWMSLSSNILSIAAATAGPRPGSSTRVMIQPISSLRASGSASFR